MRDKEGSFKSRRREFIPSPILLPIEEREEGRGEMSTIKRLGRALLENETVRVSFSNDRETKSTKLECIERSTRLTQDFC